MVGSSGGTVSSPSGASIEVPPGAVSGDTTLQIEPRAEPRTPSLPASATSRAEVWTFTPHGQRFSQPVTIRVPFRNTGEAVLLVSSQPDGAWQLVPGSRVEGSAVVALVDHFSYFTVITGVLPDGGPMGCGPINCAGCCTAAGTCEPGTAQVMCGGGGALCTVCSPGEACAMGLCQPAGCNPTTCTGCCLGTICMSGQSPMGCGVGGVACSLCTAPTDTCAGGVCQQPDAGPACGPGTCAGCCVGNSCQAPSAVACGTGGFACVTCGLGQTCSGGACVVPDAGVCGPGTCTGCCQSGFCLTGAQTGACGVGGAQCQACAMGDVCSLGVCTTPGDGGSMSCGPGTCVGCCSGNTCVTVPGVAACGGGGSACVACGASQVCIGGTCQATSDAGSCGPGTCSGCCSSGVCQPGTLPAFCGAGGALCATCMPGDGCLTGACVPPLDGGFVCGPSTCAGCCAGNLCLPGTLAGACGVAGGACVTCAMNEPCSLGLCQSIDAGVPRMAWMFPNRGPVGSLVSCRGTGLSGMTVAQWGLFLMPVLLTTATEVQVVVPAGAALGTTAEITLMTPSAASVSCGSFTLTGADAGLGSADGGAQVTGFAPTQGLTGTVVTLTGSELQTFTAVRFQNAPQAIVGGSAVDMTIIVGGSAGVAPFELSAPSGVTVFTASDFRLLASDGGTGGGSAGGAAAGGGSAGGAGADAGADAGAAGGGAAGGGAAGGGAAGGSAADGGSGGGTGGGSAGGGAAGGAADAGPPTGESCLTAIPVGPGDTSGTTVGAASDFSFLTTSPAPANTATACRGTPTPGPDLVFSTTVPQGQYLRAQLTTPFPDAGGFWSALLDIVPGVSWCSSLAALTIDGGVPATFCAGSDPAGLSVQRAGFYNDTAASQTAFLLVKGASATAAGGFTLTTAVSPLPIGERCEAPLVLDGGSVTLFVGSSSVNDYSGVGTGCASASNGPDVAVQLPPLGVGQRATIVVQPDAGLDVSLSLAASATDCRQRACSSTVNSGGAGVAERLTTVNRGMAASDLIALVDTALTTSAGEVTIAATIDTPPIGDRCDIATPLIPGTPLVGETLANNTNDYTTSGTNCSTTFAGLDRAYAVVVPAQHSLSILVQPEATLNTSLSLAQTAANCDARVCLVNANQGAAGQADSFTLNNASSNPQTWFVVVDSATGTGATFDLSATVTPLATGDNCANATPADLDGGVLSGLGSAGYTNDYSSGTACAFLSGNDRAFSLTIPPGQRGVFRAMPDAGLNVSLSLIGAPETNCQGAITCLAGVDAFGATTPPDRTEVLTRMNSTGAAQTVFAIVDTSGVGFFDFQAFLDTPVPGDRCEAPLVLTPAVAQPGDFAAFVNDYFGAGSGCSANAARADAVYRLTVPDGQEVDLIVTPAAGLNTSLSIATSASACDARSCVATSNNGGDGLPDSLRFANRSGGAIDYLVIVDHTTVAPMSNPPTGFTLLATLRPPASGETCQTATTLTTPVDGESLAGFFNDYQSANNCLYSSGPDRVYAVSVPPGRTTFTLTPDAGLDLAASIVDAPAATCDAPARACVTGANAGSGVERLAVSNTGAGPRDVFLVVSASSGAGLYSVAQTTGPIVPGEDCDSAEPMPTDGGRLSSQTTFNFASEYGAVTSNGCIGSTGPDRLYRATVPPGQRFTATVYPDAGYDPQIDLMVGGLGACSRRECLGANGLLGTGAAETVDWTNGSPAPVEVFLNVDGAFFTGPQGSGNFDVVGSLSAALPGDTCDNALAVSNGTLLSASTAPNTRDVVVPVDANGCQTVVGRDLVYVASVPAGQTLDVRLSGVSGNPSVNVIEAPASRCGLYPVCVASADNPVSGGNEALQWTNPGPASRQVFIVIGPANGALTVGFSLAVSIF
ncbi:MAG: hypothetical protein JNJ54_28135 [Myxococcaceae bacterium]|nr:hypothetical protein [Myxococcaceae bacterium]